MEAPLQFFRDHGAERIVAAAAQVVSVGKIRADVTQHAYYGQESEVLLSPSPSGGLGKGN